MIVAGLLTGLWDGFATAIVVALNAVIAALGSVIGDAFSALPSMPDLPTPPTTLTNVEGWVAWVFPVSTVVDILTFTSTMYFLWWVVTIALRWAKAHGH